jgi:hypothetical protein
MDNNNNEFGCHGQPRFEDIVRAGQAALKRLTDCETWNDWLLVGEALVIGRSEAMRAAHIKEPIGSKYNKEFGIWLTANNFHAIDKSTRSRLLDCMEHRAEIEAWRKIITPDERMKYNHPHTVIRRWRLKTPTPNQNAAPKLSHTAKLKASIAELEEENFRMRKEIERGGGDLWTHDDTAKDIALVISSQFSRSKSSAIARELAKLAREKSSDAKARQVAQVCRNGTPPSDVR